jgi:MFS transporter, NNP family, nitrate/nitrite transporter
MVRTPEKWDVEDDAFWELTGKPIANRNLWVSIPNLLCGFSVWLYWGMIAKAIRRIHFANPTLFNFTFGNGGVPYGNDRAGYTALLLTLPAVAGLMGATLRIPNSFMIAICGGRNVKFMTTLLLIIPAIGTGYVLQQPKPDFSMLIVLAALSGVGGGAFASSMSNISYFFPKRTLGLALGLNAGLGNAGVSVMQFLIPWVITFQLFGPLGGASQELGSGGETSLLWVQNAAFVWVPIMAFLVIATWLYMNNLPQQEVESTRVGIGRYLWMMSLGFAGGGLGVVLLIADWGPIPQLLKVFAILVITIAVTLALMRYGTPKSIQTSLKKQFEVFGNKHNWAMTWLYTMTFGSFIGYANAFPILIDVVFGQISVGPDGTALAAAIPNPNAPTTAYYIWIGAGVGALIRPVGGWLADRLGGARVTQWDTYLMVVATIVAGYFVYLARQSNTPETYFFPFLVSFVILFAATGIGNGSTFRMIPIIFSKEQAGPVLGWTSAVAAYGAFFIPKILATQIKAGTPEYALYGFAVYYVSCLIVNWWFYARKGAEIQC